MQAFVFFPLFLVVTLTFGYFLSLVVLGERRIFAVAPFTVVIGINAYNFLVNLSSYVFPIALTPVSVLAIMAALDVAFIVFVHRRGLALVPERGAITWRELTILFATAVAVSLFAGAFAIRSLGFDDLNISHLPLVSTILAGNFPVMEPTAPDRPIEYHYGSELLTAALTRAAAVPPWLGYDIQMILFSGAAFLMAFVLAFDLIGRWRGAAIAALLMLFGAGLTWLHFTEGISPLWHKFVLGEEVFAPWKFLATMTGPRMNLSILVKMFNHNAAVGFPVMLFVIVLFLRMAGSSGRRLAACALTAGVAFGYLALNLETNFIILGGAMGAGLVAVLVFGRHSSSPVLDHRSFVIATFAVLVIGSLLAFYQGGILSVIGAGGGRSSFTWARHILTLDFTVSPWSSPEPVRLFSWTMLEEFGLVLAIFIPALWAFRRNPQVLFLSLIAVAAFLVPFVIRYETRPHDIKRLFGISTPFMYFIGGLYLDQALNRVASQKWRTWFIWSLVLLGVSWSLYYLAVYIVTPYGYIGQLDRPLIERPPAPAAIDARTYDWIRRNTTIADRFFPFNNDFIRDTGRFTPGFFEPVWGYADIKAIYQEIVRSCDPALFKKLGISYLYVSPDFPMGDRTESCLEKLNTELVYKSEEGGDFRKIYRFQ